MVLVLRQGNVFFSFFVTDDEVKPIPPSIIWDLAEGNLDENENFIDREILKNQVIPSAIKSLEFYKDELQQERKRQAEIKQKYGIKSLEYLIVKLDGEIIELESRKDRKENVDLPLRMKKEKKAEYEQALTTLKIQIEQEQSLSYDNAKIF